MKLLPKQKETQRLREKLMIVGGMDGEGIVREFGIHTHTLLYLKCITNKDRLYSTWNSAQCYAPAWMGGEFGGEWIHVYICSPEAVTTLLIGYTPIKQQKKKKKKQKKIYEAEC